jgi:5-methyltetrahydrofolate--homocysteine methyltransferase
MTPAEKILETARKERVDIIGLSGLITPSLEEMVQVAKEMNREGFTIPLLIGGATTSIMHTAVKIQPEYSHGVVHVKDASRSVTVVSNLLSEKNKISFLEEVNTKYKELREMNAGLSRNYVSLEEARENKTPVDWKQYDPPIPRYPGTKVFKDYDLSELIPYIDWTFFFHVWELKGRFPEILDHPAKGKEAKKLYHDAQQFLKEIIQSRSIHANALISLLPANARGDDIEIYADEKRRDVLFTLNHLRQQSAKTPTGHHQSLSDFIAPKESDKKDYLGIIAATAGLGLEEYLRPFEKDHDDYAVIMIKALTDRLAEALVERLHERIRKEFWAFAPGENVSPADLFLTKYQGVRPAYGYPACPDHSEKKKLFEFLEIEKNTGIHLTEKYSMYPAASVCCLVFSHPSSSYIEVGKITVDQVRDYSSRKNEPLAVTERWLAPVLNYK